MGCLSLTKCCCCVPLRPGLLAWAYIRLILVVATVGVLIFVTQGMLRLRYAHSEGLNGMEIPLLIYLGVCLVDLIFSIIFVVSVHHENYKLLLVYYVYGIFEVLVMAVALGIQFYFLAVTEQRRARSFWTNGTIQTIIPIVINLLLPSYFLLIIRSELLKIKAGGDQTDRNRENTHVIHNIPRVTQQDIKYVLGHSKLGSTQTASNYNKPVFPIQDLRIQELRQEDLEGKE